ncbi:CIA30 family protein [Carboxylicivirga sp. M1479]|uniref:CIA30 family protein n=1 Tax=Carboxylicivirga sp. M1479 TaxID=2594476 RepID=UPI0011785BC4|nr:CIA30 family protein [Carboxylicivirga sp. M1479]TRX66200.1 CIA30 family protein [Carboxylicivirga sp. M1479]
MNACGQITICDFSKSNSLLDWTIINDGVMGGLSESDIKLNEDNNAVFFGVVSLKNNGGFASVRHQFKPLDVHASALLILSLKGDGKRYQIRVKANSGDRHSYINYFETTGEWQTVEISLSDMYPTFRGRRLNMPNFSGERIEELSILIANKSAEVFRLELESIKLK